MNKEDKKMKKNNKDVEKKKKTYTDPLSAWWGKLLIWIISICMIAGIIIGLVFAILEA